ncbi:MAG: formylglycine-generating enzyme family protein [Bacteroidales bacterium]|nr:formylglycine-generating enzyme family protein [Bacteroidales bacterium]
MRPITRHIILIICLVASTEALAQANRWFGMEGADSTRWGWNLVFDKWDGINLPNDNPISEPSMMFSYVATDTAEISMEGYLVEFDGFFMLRNEVTQRMWMLVMGKRNPCWNELGDDLPATICSPSEAVAFCEKLNETIGLGFRLPTMGEWILAARGGHYSEGYRYSGSNNADLVAWHEGNSGGRLHPVKELIPNELTLYDMSGNAAELVVNGDITPLFGNDSVVLHSYTIMGGSSTKPATSFYSPSTTGHQTTEPVGFRIVYPRKLSYFDSSKNQE